jgi:hypothetical protein
MTSNSDSSASSPGGTRSDRRPFPPVALLAATLEVPHPVGSALTHGDDVVVFESFPRITVDASSVVPPPNLAPEMLRNGISTALRLRRRASFNDSYLAAHFFESLLQTYRIGLSHSLSYGLQRNVLGPLNQLCDSALPPVSQDGYVHENCGQLVLSFDAGQLDSELPLDEVSTPLGALGLYRCAFLGTSCILGPLRLLLPPHFASGFPGSFRALSASMSSRLGPSVRAVWPAISSRLGTTRRRCCGISAR